MKFIIELNIFIYLLNLNLVLVFYFIADFVDLKVVLEYQPEVLSISDCCYFFCKS